MKGDIQRIFQEFGDEFIRENQDRLTGQHLKIINAIRNCGTPAAGWLKFGCTECGKPHYIERSCGNRLCPTCQHGKTQSWLDQRLQQQLPTHYFLITFTVPEELNPFLLHTQDEGYNAMFKAAAGALKKLAGNPRFIGVDLPGFFGVLHTWGRTLNYHPHIHFVVPGGGIDKASGLWRCSRQDFYAPGQALAEVCKGIFGEEMKNAGLDHCINPLVWQKKWVVDCEAVGHNREGIVKYLAPYVFRTGISDSRILEVKDRKVTFGYVKSASRRPRRMTLDVMEFLRRYLMHVLPCGFMRIRHYGFMGSGSKIPQDELVAMVRIAQAFEVDPVEYVPAVKKKIRCPECGGALVFTGAIKPTTVLSVTAAPPFNKRE
jgi:hypothetical protein